MSDPQADDWIVSRDKIVDYLLNPTHPDGASKARFFRSFGFAVDNWKALADALKSLAKRSKTVRELATKHGRKYIVDGTIDTPTGRSVTVRTVWIMDAGESSRRLVTAYPQQQEA